MSSAQDWIEETRDHLEGPAGSEANQVDTDYVAGSGTITLRYALGNVTVNSVLSVGGNTLRVQAVNSTAKTASVIAGFQGSVDVDAPAGSLVRVNPNFTDHRILKALNGAMATMTSPVNGLFQVSTAALDYVSFQEAYDMGFLTSTEGPLFPDRLVQVLEVRRETRGTSLAWPRVRPSEWELVETAPTDIFPSGVALRVKEGDSGLRVQVVAATTFMPFAAVTDDVSTTGVPDSMADIPPLGAAIRLMSGKEVSRNLTRSQADSRKATEVPAGAIANSYTGLFALWSTRVREEAARLRKKYPVGI